MATDLVARVDLERELASLHAASFAWALVACGYDRAEADDVLQSVYEKVLDGRARFERRSSLKTWLFAIIRRTAASRRRTVWLRRALLARWTEAQPEASPAATPHERAELDERGRRVLDAVRALAARQRQVIELVFYHDLSVEQAAEVMGVGVGTARVHYDRGKRNLLAALKEAP